MNEEQNVEVVVEKDGALTNAPWWLVSAGLHVVVMLGMTLIYVERLMAIEMSGPIVSIANDIGPRIEPPEPERDIHTGKHPSLSNEKSDTTANDEPEIVNPFAKIGDHNESADEQEYKEMLGNSPDARGYIDGNATGFGRTKSSTPGQSSMIGVGPGGGGTGRYTKRGKGGRENIVKRGGGSQATESAVMAALKWLARHQEADGSWKAAGFSKQCIGAKCGGSGADDTDIGVTGLALLAFLGAGYSAQSRDEFPDPVDPTRTLKFGAVVKHGVLWLMSQQDPEGCIGDRASRYMYSHSIAALALCEAYGMSATSAVREPAQKAIDFIVAAQNPGKGWRYTSRCGDNDTSVTGWAVMALKSAELSELMIPKSAYDGALSWLNEVTDQNGYYRAGYMRAGDGPVFERGKNEQFSNHPSMTAVAVMSRIFIQREKRDPALGGAQLLVGDLPEWKTNKVDAYYWYYGSLALFQYDGPTGPMWSKWNEPMKNAIVPNQKTSKDGCQNGSWNPEEDRWGHAGGRVYSVAINALTLEVYYRYKNVFGSK